MPTSKLWLEHTERAAWDSVEALRERLLQAEARLSALAPNVDQLPELLELLDRAKQDLRLQAVSYAQVLQELLDRLEQAEAAATAAKTPPPIQVSFGEREKPVSARDRSTRDGQDDDEQEQQEKRSQDKSAAALRHEDAYSDQEPESDPDGAEFARAVQRRTASAGAELPKDLNRLLLLLEKKVDDLAELEEASLREAAVDLAMLAARLCSASRGQKR